MEQGTIDLKKEQEATLARPRYRYSAMAHLLFRSMDMVTGKQDTLFKARLIEALAPVPYRAWEKRQYQLMKAGGADQTLLRQARAIAEWGREAKDNEYQHVTLLNAKLREDGQPQPRYLREPLPSLIVASWRLAQWVLSRVAIQRAFLLNAEFEDHSEHVYAQLVRDHPEWEDQPAAAAPIASYAALASWADVVRRIGLDERDHMNNSFAFAGRPEAIVNYEGMPAIHETA